MSNNDMVMVPREWVESTVGAGAGEPVCRSDIDMLKEALAAEQHQGEPVALPWRKEIPEPAGAYEFRKGWNAYHEEIAKLGPLYSRPVQGEPVAAQYRTKPVRTELLTYKEGIGFSPWQYMDLSRFNPLLTSYIDNVGYATETRALYTHADPVGVERLQIELNAASDRSKMLLEAKNHWADRARAAEAKLAERDALLRDFCAQSALICGDLLHLAREDDCATTDPIRARAYSAMDHSRKVKKALSASEEPSAPVEIDERAAFELAYQRAADCGWTSTKMLSRRIWDARAALERKS